MKIRIFILLTITFSILNNLVTNPTTISKSDTTKSIIVNDSLNERIIDNNKGNFFKRNEGAIIGSALAAFVSLFSIWLTTCLRNKRDKKEKKFNIHLENEKINRRKMEKENIYCGLIHSIFHELNYHLQLLVINRKTIKRIKDLTIEKGEYNIKQSIEKFNTKFINECRLKVLEFESFNTDILPIVSKYINKIESLNTHFDFQSTISLIKQLEMPFEDSVNLHFKELEKNFMDIELSIQEIQKMIRGEISKFSQNKIID
jgi:hypothetical protein